MPSRLAERFPELPGHDGLAEAIGLEIIECEPELARAIVPITDTIRQPIGLVHGGTYPVIAESLCSWATAVHVYEQGMMALGQSNSAVFLRPMSGEGHVNATARRLHGGRTTWVWETEMTDDDGRLCAVVRMMIAVRPIPPDVQARGVRHPGTGS